MKVNGTDPLVKLLLELNKRSGEASSTSEKVMMESLSKEVEEILARRDEVLLRGDTKLKAEVHFTRQLHETPEAYLQRISSEMAKMKETERNLLDREDAAVSLQTDTVDKALRAGLLKELVDQENKVEGRSSDTKDTRWLLVFTFIVVFILLLYLLILQ
ncbi:hypothetical protein ACHAL6_02165 [Proteiniclasticum sp. C24MP]|uniref:hypothetical protein n=1 Tax=Proteiniclasticum sp. C24MP TaxID=3374101 RepID=UPI00375469E9